MNTKPRVLVVDDEPVIRELLMDILREEGYPVETVSGAPLALQRLADTPTIDLLLTDIIMPEMDGLTLVRKAKRVCPHIAVVLMTGFATLETARAAVREGALDYITKPFSLADIKSALELAVERTNFKLGAPELEDLSEMINISESIGGVRERDPLLESVARAASKQTGATRASVMVLTPNGRELVMGSSIGIPERYQQSRVRVEGSMSGWVVKHGRSLWVSDINSRPDLANLTLGLKDQSFISVPLSRRRKPNGNGDSNGSSSVQAVINVNSKQNGQQFSEHDLKMLSIVANQSSIALENVRLLEELQSAHLATFEALSRLQEAKDPYVHGHSQRVANYAVMAGREMGLPEEELAILRLGSVLHDIGKIGVSDAITNKSGPLADEDWNIIRMHPVIGYDMLSAAPFFTDRHLALVRSHHERLDGSGYPDGLTAEAIDPLVKILSVADTYDAMSAERAYRPALRRDEMVAQLHEAANKTLDSGVVQIFIELIRTGAIVPGMSRAGV